MDHGRPRRARRQPITRWRPGCARPARLWSVSPRCRNCVSGVARILRRRSLETPGTPTGVPAARQVAARLRWCPEWCRSPTPPMASARSGCRPPVAGSSASSPASAWYRPGSDRTPGSAWPRTGRWQPLSTDAALVLSVMADRPELADVLEAKALRIAIAVKSPLALLRTDPNWTAATQAAAALLSDLGHTVSVGEPRYSVIAPISRWLAGPALDAEGLDHDYCNVAPGGTSQLEIWHNESSARAQIPPITQRAHRFFEGFDAVLTPSLAQSPPIAEPRSDRSWLANTLADSRLAPYSAQWNVLGFPGRQCAVRPRTRSPARRWGCSSPPRPVARQRSSRSPRSSSGSDPGHGSRGRSESIGADDRVPSRSEGVAVPGPTRTADPTSARRGRGRGVRHRVMSHTAPVTVSGGSSPTMNPRSTTSIFSAATCAGRMPAGQWFSSDIRWSG